MTRCAFELNLVSNFVSKLSQFQAGTSINLSKNLKTEKGLSCENPDRIINGITAERGSWPWITYIKFGFSFCGGTILDHSTVLTAAHCCNNYNSPTKYDRIEVSNYSIIGLERKAQVYIVHEKLYKLIIFMI